MPRPLNIWRLTMAVSCFQRGHWGTKTTNYFLPFTITFQTIRCRFCGLTKARRRGHRSSRGATRITGNKMPDNPFEVTKAVDFTDAQIEATWVDWPSGGFLHLADPRSPMPRFLVGGMGGGRKHTPRYFFSTLYRHPL